MRFQGLDLNLLVALDALLTEQNVSLAAQRVHLSQSAMSGALNRLRDYFKDELLIAVGRRMALTPRAETLVEPVRRALLQIETTIATPPAFDPASVQRRIRMIASDYTITVFLADVLRDVAERAPGLVFEISPPEDMPAERLERGEIDLLFGLEQFVSRQHPSELLIEDDYVVVAWSGNDAVGSSITADQYFDMGHVAVEFGRSRMPAYEEWVMQMAPRTRRVEVVCGSFSSMPLLLIGTKRIATMHRRLAAIFARTMPLKILPAPFTIPHMRQVVQWHSLRANDVGIHWLLERVRAACRRDAGGSRD